MNHAPGLGVHRRYRPLQAYYGERTGEADPAQRVGWPDAWSQSLRFEALLDLAGVLAEGSSLLDVGCGLGDLVTHLERRGPPTFAYTGIDLLPEMVEAACAGHATSRFLVSDLLDGALPDGEFDVVICSGALNVAIAGDHAAWARKMLRAMWRRTRRALVFNALDSADEDRLARCSTGSAGLARLDRRWLRGECRALTPRLVVREDVLRGELFVACFTGESGIVDRWLRSGLATPADAARVHLHNDLPVEALAALEGEPDDAETTDLRAAALLQRGASEPAERLLRRALEIDPDHLGCRRSLAAALALSGDPGASVVEWRRVLEADPEDDHSRAALARTLALCVGGQAAREEADRIADALLRERTLDWIGHRVGA